MREWSGEGSGGLERKEGGGISIPGGVRRVVYKPRKEWM